jgi:heat shock protein HtpX
MWMNNLKTVLLLALLNGLLLFIGIMFGGTFGLQMALILSCAMNFITYFFSEKIVLSMYGAKKLDENQYAWIYQIVSKLAKNMSIPMPKLWLVDTAMANAFATGRNPQHASIAVTTGILQILDQNELRGVLSHELSHIKNRDILISTIAATIATAIGYLAHMLQYAAFWGSMSSDKRQRGNPIVMLLIAILMPIAAMLIQLAISRSREYLADESGSHYSHDPLALASALKKLQRNIPHAHMQSNDTARASTAPLFIVHPFTTDGWISLFSTHPPMNKRIERLQNLYEQMHGKRF